MARSWRLAVFTTAVLVAAACSGDDNAAEVVESSPTAEPTPNTDTPAASNPGPTPAATGSGVVAELSVEATSVEPFDVVTIDDVTAALAYPDDGVAVWRTAPDVSEVELSMYAPGLEAIPLELYTEGGAVFTIVPFYPLDPMVGGDVELQFSSGPDRGAPIALSIGALTPSPGSWASAVDAIIGEIEKRAIAAGASIAQLRSTDPDAIDAELQILKAVAGLVDDGSAFDVESLAEDFDESEFEVLDALIAALDPLAAVPRDGQASEISGFAGGRRAPGSAVSGTLRRNVQLACTDFDLDIPDGAALSTYIEKGIGSQQGAASQKLAADVAAANDAAGKLNDAAGAVGSPAAGVTGVVAKATDAVNTMYTGLNAWTAMDAGRYPSRLNSLTAEISTSEFNEDFKEDGNVKKVTVVASSTGFDGSSLSSAATSVFNSTLGSKLSNVTKGGLGLDGGGAVTDNLASGLDKLRDSATGKLLKAGGDMFIDWCPQIWPVEITDGDYVELRSSSAVLNVDEGGLGYRPAEVGNAQLTIAANPGRFANEQAYVNVGITIHRLQVIAAGDKITVKRPGDAATISADTEYADTTTLVWMPGKGSWADGLGADTNGGMERTLKTPTGAGDFPFDVTIRSTSETGLRRGKSESDPRQDTVTIELEAFEVIPDGAQVVERKTRQFQALDFEGKPVEVRWEATGGRIVDGLYTAGDEPGFYTVTATSVANPSQSVTVVVEVIEAPCFVGTWHLRSQEFLDQIYDQSGAASEGLTSLTWTGGDYLFTFSPDGGFATSRQGWGFQGATDQGTILLSFTGTTSGSWEAGEDTISIAESGSTVDISVSLSTSAGVIALPTGSTDSIDVEGFSGTARFECDGDVLQVEYDGFTSTLDRVG